jgi:hypothetical protein
MSTQALGYLGLGSDKLDDWTAFAVNWLGRFTLGQVRAEVPIRTQAKREQFSVWTLINYWPDEPRSTGA